MHTMKTYQITASSQGILDALGARTLPAELIDPMRAVAADIIAATHREPVSLYVCSADADRVERDFFAAMLAKALLKQVPDVLLVDCDFLSPGLSGIVPERDSLGFLDLLLYGSSLGVVRQTSRDGVPLIGTGSFPMAKITPFAMGAFDDARRYLARHSKCVIFSGPALDDDELVHPVCAHVDIPLLLRRGRRAKAEVLDALEEQIAAGTGAMWSVRLVEPASREKAAPATTESAAGVDGEAVPPSHAAVSEGTAGDTDTDSGTELRGTEGAIDTPDEPARPLWGSSSEPAQAGRGERDAVPEEERVDAPVPPTLPESEVDIPEPDTAPEPPAPRSGSSLLPRILTISFGVIVIAFVLWWLYLTTSVRKRAEAPIEPPPVVPAAVDTMAHARPDTAAVGQDDSVGVTGTVRPDTTGSIAAGPADTLAQVDATNGDEGVGTVDDGVVADAAAAEIIVTDNLGDFRGRFMVHVSSFRTLDRARTDAYALSDRGFPIVIARVDLGGKGAWYRVYVGPFDSRDEAWDWKIKLDEIPHVKLTRMVQIPG